MKKLLLSLLVLSSSLLAFSQGTWTPRDTLPDSAMVQGIPGFSINGYGYAGLGNYNFGVGVFDKLWQFDPSTNSWTQKAPFPGRVRVAPACFVIGNKAYLVTGTTANNGTSLTECWEYNTTNDTWTQKANFPGSARTYAVGFAINGTGYVGTGAKIATNFRKDFYAYDTAGAGSWTRIADFPGIARDAANGFAVNGKGYVCFGKDSTYKLYSDMWEYNPVNNTWIQKRDNPQYVGLASGFVICNNIYVGNGDTNAIIDRYRGFWKYNTILDSWTQMASVPGVKQCEGAAFSIGDTGYYGFGCDTFAYVHNIFYRFYAGDSCDITGNNSINNVSTINIYPNPFKDECFIVMPSGFSPVPQFSLYDATGRKMPIDIQIDNSIFLLKRDILKEGVYILSIKYNTQAYYKKLVITN